MAAAEAAQQALLTSGTLAAQAQGSPTLKAILVTYLDVQRLYHKAMLLHIGRHQQLSGTPAGLACAMLCDVLAQPLAKQVGDQISSWELQEQVKRVQWRPSLQARHPVALLAIEMVEALETLPDQLSTTDQRFTFDELSTFNQMSTIDVCVMPDVLSMLAADPTASPEAAASTAGGLSGLLQSAVSKAGQLARDTELALRKSSMADALIQACKPPGSPLEYQPRVMEILHDASTARRCDSFGRVVLRMSAL
jgi:hypothetical protein